VDYPKLRNINIFPVQMSGETLLCLQDPQNISEKALFLPIPLYFIVSLFDGQHSILDIQAEYMRRFGELLFTEKIAECGIKNSNEDKKTYSEIRNPKSKFQEGFCLILSMAG
jgi:hypothetical protein